MQTKPKTPFYVLSADESLVELKSKETGLDTNEAKSRLSIFGFNILKEISGEPIVYKFLKQFKDLMIILLIASAFISLYLGDLRTTIILLAIVFINASISFFQEFKAEKIMKSLQELVVAEAKVYRENKLQVIDARELVPGDIIALEEGDFVPADCRILQESELATNDFALTGESNPSRKFTHAIKGSVEIGNRRNLVFMGTTVATGDAHCLVVTTGMNTELGRIASLSQATPPGLSPLQKEMNNLASRITLATIILAIFLIAIALGSHLGIKDAFVFAIGIASAMIPQGLPAEVNISLVQAASKLANAKALIKKLSAVETLGATSVICTDKTGTLTKNEMTVEQVTLIDKHYLVSGSGYKTNGQILHENGLALEAQELKDIHRFFATGFFASNAKIVIDDTNQTSKCIGDPTEGALVVLAKKAGIDVAALDQTCPEIKEFPFDSVRKMMSSIRKYDDKLTIFVKGAPEAILANCTHILDAGRVRKITTKDKELINFQNNSYASKALRNLVYAYKNMPDKTNCNIHNPELFENDLVYLGMVSMIDPIRSDVANAMQAARDAHIKVSIITGDYAPTAKAIAVRAKLADSPDDIEIIGSNELSGTSDNQILQLVLKGGVIFSRVSPEDKLRIVDLVRDANKVVAVTGDGINDAPALKRADIGLAMGKTGTDVAKQSADIVLLDDSFSTLVGAIQQGRVVFGNIKKATLSCLTSNFGELITVLIGLAAASLFGISPAILAIQILAIDLIAELFPIAALGWDGADTSLMKDPPRDIKKHIFDKAAIFDLIVTGLIIGTLAYGNFLLFASRHQVAFRDISQNAALYASATTVTYVTIVLCQLCNILIRRYPGATLSKNLFTNRYLWLAFGLSIFCVFNIIYNPLVQKIFASGSIKFTDWIYILCSAGIFFATRETIKLLSKSK